MRISKFTVLMVIGLLLVLSALGLTGYNIQDEKTADETAERTVTMLKEEIVPVEEQDLPERMVPDYILDPNKVMPVEVVDGQRYVGYLSIPALGLDLPVIEEWSYPALKLAPCRYYGTPYMGTMVIAAHNYRLHFGKITNLVPGDLIQFTDVDGYLFQYRVVGMEELDPDQTKDMNSDEWNLTLFTCNMSGQRRYAVRCVSLGAAR